MPFCQYLIYSADALTRSWLAVHEAEAWSLLHQEVSCLKALEHAELVSDQIIPHVDPYWTGFDRALLFGFKGVCHLRLHNPEAAQQALNVAISEALPSSSRQLAVFFSDLAATFVLQEEPEEACHTLEKALT